MKFTPKELEGNVNVTHEKPLKELLHLLGGALGIMFLIYVLLGFAVDLIVPRLPQGMEEAIGDFFSEKFVKAGVAYTDKDFQEIVDDLAKDLSHEKGYYKVSVVRDPEFNAIALPGRHIIIFSELMKVIETENELAFVLGHELGHYAHKDHLRGLGRGLVLTSMSIFLLGSDSSVSEFLMNSLTNIEMKFSRNQETAADLYALKCLNERYGHIGGAVSFMEKIKEKEELWKLFYYFASHPHPDDRIKSLKDEIKKNGYKTKEEIPLKKDS